MMDLARVQVIMNQKGIDVLVLQSPENIFYTSDIPSLLSSINPTIFYERKPIPLFSIVPKDGKPTVIYARGLEPCLTESTISDKVYYGGTAVLHYHVEGAKEDVIAATAPKAVAKVLEQKGFTKGKVGIEREDLSISWYELLSKELPDAKFKNADEVLDEAKLIKTQREIERLRKVAEITEAGFMAAIDAIDEGVTEFDLLDIVKETYWKKGCLWNDLNIGVGANGACPDCNPTEHKIERGDVVRIDGGAIFEGYFGDVARMAALGNAPDRVKRMHKIMVEAQEKVIDSMRPGVVVSDLFSLGQESVRKSGYPDYTRGHIGHSLGVSVEEWPHISPGVKLKLEPNMVFAVELPYYIPGLAGIQPEDMVRIAEDGVEWLSKTDRDLYVR
jgi:Xaa-Pro aminopeptidase